ncbi:hypothetical protein BGX29_012054 [Mortierella sp. GBA35]|nr:hypothetical protein BGX29_012054 [Mortierella sp. GBA35]
MPMLTWIPMGQLLQGAAWTMMLEIMPHPIAHLAERDGYHPLSISHLPPLISIAAVVEGAAATIVPLPVPMSDENADAFATACSSTASPALVHPRTKVSTRPSWAARDPNLMDRRAGEWVRRLSANSAEFLPLVLVIRRNSRPGQHAISLGSSYRVVRFWGRGSETWGIRNELHGPGSRGYQVEEYGCLVHLLRYDADYADRYLWNIESEDDYMDPT